MGDSEQTEADKVLTISNNNYKSALGRPRGNGPGITKHCQFGICKSDSRSLWKANNSSIHFIPFPKPCLEFRKGKIHEVAQCRQCSKARKWLDMCKRADGRFNELWHIKPYHYICSLHFAGGNGPTESFPDPFSANTTQVKKNKLMKILETESLNQLETEVQGYDDDLKENPSAKVAYSTLQPSSKEGSKHKLFVMADMFMKSSGCSVELTLEYLSVKLCSGMFVEKEFRFFDLDSRLEIYVFNQLLPTNHNMYLELKRIDVFTSGIRLFTKVFNSWYSCIGIRGKELISLFNEAENKTKGVYVAVREAIFSQKCSVLFKRINDERVGFDQCEECQKMNVSLTKALERKNRNNSRANYNKMTYAELIKCLKSKSVQNNYYKQKLEKLGMLKNVAKTESDSMEEEVVEDMETKDEGDVSVCTITFQDLDQFDASLSESELYVYNNTIMRSVLKPQVANDCDEPLTSSSQMQVDDLC